MLILDLDLDLDLDLAVCAWRGGEVVDGVGVDGSVA
jgi:hypothetical protein